MRNIKYIRVALADYTVALLNACAPANRETIPEVRVYAGYGTFGCI